MIGALNLAERPVLAGAITLIGWRRDKSELEGFTMGKRVAQCPAVALVGFIPTMVHENQRHIYQLGSPQRHINRRY